MKRIKVLYIGISDTLGGIERFIINICTLINRDIFSVGVIAYSTKYVEPEIFNELGVTVYPLTTKKEYDSIIKLFDIIHFNKNSALDLFALNIANKYNKKVIWHSHNTGLSHHNNFLFRFIHKLRRSYVVNHSNVLLACSNLAGKWMYGKKDFIFIPNGVNLQNIHFEDGVREEICRKFNIQSNSKIYGNVCRFSKQKNLFYLLDLFNLILKSESNSTLLLVGDGPLFEQLKDYSEKLGIQNSVDFTGFVKDVGDYYSAIDIMIVPSLYEGFPMTIVEGQACGCLCFVSDTITNQVKVTSAVNFFSLNDRIEDVVKNILKADTSKRKRIIEEFNNSIFLGQNMCKSIENTYLSLIKHEN
ncbi:MAG: glycosyltransferase [Bacilli bacterium]|nr:glycosyltransferase [Bacilli bacterium]